MIKYITLLLNLASIDFSNLTVKLIIKKILNINKFPQATVTFIGALFLILSKQSLAYPAYWIFLNVVFYLIRIKLWKQISLKDLFNSALHAGSISLILHKSSYKVEFQPLEDLIDEEEKKEHEDVTNKILEKLPIIEQNFKENMQYFGVAGMYEMAEEYLTFTEERVSEHSERSANIAENLSPGNSPGTGASNSILNLLKKVDNDNEAALTEDKDQTRDTVKEGIKTSIHCSLGTGNYRNYTNSQNDLF